MSASPGASVEEAQPDGKDAGLSRRATVVLLVVLAAVAVFTRVFRFWEGPYLGFVDIGAHAGSTLDLLQNGFKAPWALGWGNVPSFYWYTLIPFFKVLSPPILAQKVAVISFSLLSLLLTYLFLRDLGGPLLALLGLHVLVFNRYFLFYSRYPMEPCTVFFLFAATALCFRRGLLGTGRTALSYSIAAGFLLAAAQHVYLSARFLIPTFLFYLAYLVHTHRRREGILRRSGVFLATFAVCVLPLAFSYWENPDALTTRQTEIGALGKFSAGELISNYVETARSFLDRPDPFANQNLPSKPLINPLLAGLFLLGLAAVVALWKTEVAVFGLLAFFITLPATSLTVEPYNSKRILNALLGFTVLVAWPWAVALARLGRRRRLRRTVLAVWLAAVAGFGVWDFKLLFVDFATDRNSITYSSYHAVAIALRVSREAVDNDVVLLPARLEPQGSSFHPGARVERFDFWHLVPVGRRRDRDVVFLLDSGDQRWLPLLRTFYPTCSMEELSYGHGYSGVRFHLSAAEINSRIGVLTRQRRPEGPSSEERVLAPDAGGTIRFVGVPQGSHVEAHGLVYFARDLELRLEGEGEVAIDVDGASSRRMSLQGAETVSIASAGTGWRPWAISFLQASPAGAPLTVTSMRPETEFFAGTPPDAGYRFLFTTALADVRDGKIAYVPDPFATSRWYGLPLGHLVLAGELDGRPGEWQIRWESEQEPRIALGPGGFRPLAGAEPDRTAVRIEGPIAFGVLFDENVSEPAVSLQSVPPALSSGGPGDARVCPPRGGLDELLARVELTDLSVPIDGLGRLLTFRQDWGRLRLDNSVDGRSLQVGGKATLRGIGTHANSTIALALLPGHSKLTGAVGVDDEVGTKGSVVFRILADGAEVWRSGVLRGGMPAVPFRVDVPETSRLNLVVEDAQDGNEFDHADWLDLRLE